MTYEDVRTIALAFPGVEDSTSYGTPALKVKGKFLTRLKEDGDSIVIRVGFDEREMLMEAFPDTYYITDHYRDYPAVLVRLSKADPQAVCRFLERLWREAAPKRLVKDYDARA
ncbi:MAG: MmcQ/YjbR family DNA-binding protein [Methylobacteriaceae bacterium]|nr:MmcQ/YjbR family DNA-binding protein [Methylobacteriaceae bacterium]MBV9246066.1 MmcQ/YjbR family DNA-binding protein [Methylobacteriaceae bacterium]MBV9636230.1 MmcQ/YjbR family DNA-binding protein [Methylobacteriaceae bacterium]MBV9703765.1 MmcQ/YjbR family DNA-binding protein [Methylobacteriaceae bacterium]